MKRISGSESLRNTTSKGEGHIKDHRNLTVCFGRHRIASDPKGDRQRRSFPAVADGRKRLAATVLWLAVSLLLVCPGRVFAQPARDDAAMRNRLKLEPTRSWEMRPGTHRPEILVNGKDVWLVVVDHDGLVRHRAYRYRYPDLDRPVQWFNVAKITDRYGAPADHRALIQENELVVVYQSNVMDANRSRRPPRTGPAENNAASQNLLLARFTLGGKEILRRPIVAGVTDFREDNFPDFCILWRRDRLLISTGTRARKLHIREVDLQAKVLAVHEISCGPDTIRSNIGNSFLLNEDGVHLVGSSGPQNPAEILTMTRLDDDLGPLDTKRLNSLDVQQHFPTDNLRVDGNQLIAYISRKWQPGQRGLEGNPYNACLKIISSDPGQVAEDLVVGKRGFAHVHPTLARIGDRLLVAWSRRSERTENRGPRSMPQVVIQEYRMTTRAR